MAYSTDCAVDGCDAVMVIHQAMTTTDATLVSIPVCAKHYGLQDVMRDDAPGL